MNKEPRIAVLYIALGRYITFWNDFYRSCEKNFLKQSSKTYYVFTDRECFDFMGNKNVVKVEQKKLGWPNDTLMRFRMFLSIEEILKDFDYIFFFNSNMEFVAKIGNEILPSEINNGLVMGLHPGFDKKKKEDFSYERNPESHAYVPYGEGKHYVQGCLNGGVSEAYLKLCRECSQNIDKDLNKQVIALWHDESHLNKYILDKTPLLLPETYLYPEAGHMFWKLNPSIKIIQRDKSRFKHGGFNYLRGINDNKISLVEYWIKKLNKDANK